MKFLALSIIAILNLSIISSRSLGQKKGGDFLADLHLLVKQEGRMNIFSMKTILLNYVESKKVLARKVKEKIFTEIRKKNLRSPWQDKEDMLARMLK